MKRRIASDHSFGGTLKRRSSSLFSIDTIQESSLPPSRFPSELQFTSANDLLPLDGKQQDTTTIATATTSPSSSSSIQHIRSISNSSPYATETEVSTDCTGGFYIDEELSDDDDDDDNETTGNNIANHKLKLIPTFMSVKNEKALQATVETKTTTTACSSSSVSHPPVIVDEHLRTGIVFESGSKHFDRNNRLHKERPLRVTSVMDALERSSLFPKLNVLNHDDHDDDNTSSSPERVFLDDEDYLQVHLPGYMKRLEKLSTCNCCDRLDLEAEQFKSIYLTKDTVTEAKKAATSLCRLVSKVVQGDLDNGFAIIRPPGHHAEPGLASGYCVINNVAVAAAFAREKLGLEKVLIVDFDVHHGQGTQSIFLNDPNVLYFSVHRWHGGNFFPFLANGGPTNVGIDDGKGFNVNVGWSRNGMGDAEYLAVWETILMPIANEFQPNLVLVSAGFDAALGDMGECNVTSECFGRLTRSLMTLADGKVVCALEGGYVRSVLAKCVESVLTNLLDRDSTQISEAETKERVEARNGTDVLDTIDSSATKSILATIAAHEPYWPCLCK